MIHVGGSDDESASDSSSKLIIAFLVVDSMPVEKYGRSWFDYL